MQVFDIFGSDLIEGIAFATLLSVSVIVNHLSKRIVKESIEYERTGIENISSMISRFANKLTVVGSNDYLASRRTFLRLHLAITVLCLGLILLFTFTPLAIVTFIFYLCVFSEMLYDFRNRGYLEDTVEYLVQRVDESANGVRELEKIRMEMQDLIAYNKDAFAEFLEILAHRSDAVSEKAREISRCVRES